MDNDPKIFRRPDGSPYDPSPFNVRQYEEQYGPGGVPEGWSMDAITPVQSPGLIIAIGVFLTLISALMLVMGFTMVDSDAQAGTIVLCFAFGLGGLAGSVQAFRVAVKRRRWLRDQPANAGQR